MSLWHLAALNTNNKRNPLAEHVGNCQMAGGLGGMGDKGEEIKKYKSGEETKMVA